MSVLGMDVVGLGMEEVADVYDCYVNVLADYYCCYVNAECMAGEPPSSPPRAPRRLEERKEEAVVLEVTRSRRWGALAPRVSLR